MYTRPILKELLARMNESRRFIQVLAGPRQTGKTTLARQVMEMFEGAKHYASADEPVLKDRNWIEQQWETCRTLIRRDPENHRGLLILDEIQKISGWSETVKRLWDEDAAASFPLYVLVLGSAPLLVQQGLSESLAGRFEILPVTHWSYDEMGNAFGWELDQYIYYGGYPGAAPLVDNHPRWKRYIIDSLIETSISRDVLLMTRVDKPALLRRLFELGCAYSGQILSYQKMIGQLQDAGNTVTLAHYLQLLGGAGMVVGVMKYAGQQVRKRGSSPKLLVLNNALMSATMESTFEETRRDSEAWGRLVESAVGAHLWNGATGTDMQVFYWSGRNREVDYILSRGKRVVALEVKSGRRKTGLPGIDAFAKEFPVSKKLLVGAQGLSLGDFFRISPEELLN